MRDVLLKIVGDLTIAESNCPRGARVAVVTYNNEVTTEIRFAESKKKSVLLDRIKNLQVALTSKQQSLETAMSFVARNTYKRVRGGFLMRRVAVFFSSKPARATPQLREAVLKLSDAGITPLFLTTQEDPQLVNALQVCAPGTPMSPPAPLGLWDGAQARPCPPPRPRPRVCRRCRRLAWPRPSPGRSPGRPLAGAGSVSPPAPHVLEETLPGPSRGTCHHPARSSDSSDRSSLVCAAVRTFL